MHPRRRHGRRASTVPGSAAGSPAPRGGSGVDPRTGPVWRGAARGRRVASRRGRSRRSGGRGEAGSHRGRPRILARFARTRRRGRRRRRRAATPPRLRRDASAPPPATRAGRVVCRTRASVGAGVGAAGGRAPRRAWRGPGRNACATSNRARRVRVRNADPPWANVRRFRNYDYIDGRLYSPPLHSTRQIGSS